MGNNRVTADDVAFLAGVSRSTVSRAFSPGRPVQQQTKQRILKAAAELGYHPNALAQALTSRKSQIIGIVLGELSNPIHAVLHQSMTHALQSSGYIPISAQISAESDIDNMISTFLQYQVGVVVLTSMVISTQLISHIQDAGLQVLLLNRVDEEGETASVSADVTQGGQLAARHLVHKGCKTIAIAKGPAGYWTTEARFAGHLSGLQKLGQEPTRILDGGYTYEDGMRVAHEVVQATEMPDGILCPNDLFAIGFMDTLRDETGLDVPRQIRVVGFDDIPMAHWTGNRLTTIRLPVLNMARRAADMIERIIREEEPVQERIWIPCKLVERAST